MELLTENEVERVLEQLIKGNMAQGKDALSHDSYIRAILGAGGGVQNWSIFVLIPDILNIQSILSLIRFILTHSLYQQMR